MLKGLNIEVFQPFSSVIKHQKSLKLNDYSVTMKVMYKNKKIDKEVGAPEKVTVPFLCLTSISEGILQVLCRATGMARIVDMLGSNLTAGKCYLQGIWVPRQQSLVFSTQGSKNSTRDKITTLQQCGKKPLADLKTVILLSRKMFRLQLMSFKAAVS